jgi:Flp pilus assembly pilin Flp
VVFRVIYNEKLGARFIMDIERRDAKVYIESQESVMKGIWKAFCADERGVTAIEYAFIASMIGVVIVGSLSNIAVGLNDIFSNASNGL